VDQGVISFVNFSDAGFGESALWARKKLSAKDIAAVKKRNEENKGKGGVKRR
jgi:hypothetical protein